MAVHVCSEISSPRISFSHDLKELDSVPIQSTHSRSDALLLIPTVDFDFCNSFPQEISSADELFADGKILPVEIKKPDLPKKAHQLPNPDPNPKPHKSSSEFRKQSTKKKRLIEFLSFDEEEEEEEEEDEKPSTTTKPFWQFRRSSSVNCDNGRGNGLLRSLQFLSRSNSTGSVPNPKPKTMQKQHSLREGSAQRVNSSYAPSLNHHCSSSSGNYYYSNSSKKPYLRQSSSRSHGNGVRIFSPVLNIHPTYNIAKGTVSLFGIGSIFCSKKSQKKRK